MQTNGPFNERVTSLVVSGTNLFAVTDGGFFLSTNNGASWTERNSGLTNTGVACLSVSGTNLFAATGLVWGEGLWEGGGSVFLSTNNGTSWAEVNAGLTNLNVKALAVSGTNLFAGTYGGGVFLSTNKGTSWTEVNSGLTDTLVNALAVSGTNLFAGTGGSGVWRRPLSELITAVENEPIQPTEFLLSQNYPNPFNPTTKISYAIPQNSFVEMKVFNLLGQEIVTLVNQEKPAGNYEINFNASNLPSGVYIYKMKAGEYVETRKMILLK